MDKLDVLRMAEELGGTDRREVMESVARAALDLGARAEVGGGKTGGLNLRYGSIGFAVLDMKVDGTVRLHAQPHQKLHVSDARHDEHNAWIEENDEIEMRNGEVGQWGEMDGMLEDTDPEALKAWIARSIKGIRDTFYKPHISSGPSQDAVMAMPG